MSAPADGGHDLDAVCERIRVERRILGDERAALATFRDRIAALDAPVPSDAVERHYRATVMSVPHFLAEYGDSFARSVAAEFGSIIAGDLQREGALDAHELAAIDRAAERAIVERDGVVDRLDAERHSVASAAEDLAEIRTDLRGLGRADRSASARTSGDDRPLRLRLAALRERCGEVARSRRHHIQSRGTAEADDSRSRLEALLYGECDADRPVLAAVRATHRAIDDRRQQVLGGASAGQ